jgi:para-aminobenzoate synthetase component 1
MITRIEPFDASPTPEALMARLGGVPGRMLLRSGLFDPQQGRYSFVTAKPCAVFQSRGARCRISGGAGHQDVLGDPWRVLDELMQRYELPDQIDQPFPLGGAFGYWGFGMRVFSEPRLARRVDDDVPLPDCHVGFCPSLVVFDHLLGKTWIVASGLDADGSRSAAQAGVQVEFWRSRLAAAKVLANGPSRDQAAPGVGGAPLFVDAVRSSLPRERFLERVSAALRYIRAGDIYQVNLAQRLSVPSQLRPWTLYERLVAVSPVSFAAYVECDRAALCSVSPELFLRLSGAQIRTRPIKGTRPRSADPLRDTQLSYELQTSPKEMAELVMITDLLRNDLGRVCEYGSIHVPELARLERFAQVQHLVATVEGRLRPEVTHLEALARCFPGGSISGAPKIRALEIIDELEPVARGAYTGAIGYLGFNRESQLSVAIRTAVHTPDWTHYHTGAGIVADSVPEAEFDETLAKAACFMAAVGAPRQPQSA